MPLRAIGVRPRRDWTRCCQSSCGRSSRPRTSESGCRRRPARWTMVAEAAMSEPIIGRRADLQALAGFVEALPRGGQALLIEGDAGIGKTALWREGVRTAQEHGVRLLSARAAHAETRIAFATIGDLIAPALDEALPCSRRYSAERSRSQWCCASPTGRRPRRVCSGLRWSPSCGRSLVSRRCCSRSTTCSGSTRARRRFSASRCIDWRANPSGSSRPCAGVPSERRSISIVPSPRSGGCRSDRSRSALSIDCSGRDCR